MHHRRGPDNRTSRTPVLLTCAAGGLFLLFGFGKCGVLHQQLLVSGPATPCKHIYARTKILIGGLCQARPRFTFFFSVMTLLGRKMVGGGTLWTLGWNALASPAPSHQHHPQRFAWVDGAVLIYAAGTCAAGTYAGTYAAGTYDT